MSNRQIRRDPQFTRNVWNCFVPDFSSVLLNVLHLHKMFGSAPVQSCCCRAEGFLRVCSSLWLRRPCLSASSRTCWSYFKVQLVSWDHFLSSSGPKFSQWTVWVLPNPAAPVFYSSVPFSPLLNPVALQFRFSLEALQKDAVLSQDQCISH